MNQDPPRCSNCVHSKPDSFLRLWDRQHPLRNARLKNYIMRRAYGNVHCVMVKKDKDNFPHKLAELSNWDEKLLPQHCGQYKKRPNFLIFSERGNYNWYFIGAYSTPEIVEKAEVSIMYPHVISNFKEFQEEVPRKALEFIADHLIVKLPFESKDITHEMVWDILQLHLADNDVFDKLNCWDWLRSLFTQKGDISTFAIMSRYGVYPMITLRGVIKDLRSPKYAKGKVIDIRPRHPYMREYANGVVPRDGTWEAERLYYGDKQFVRVA